MGALLEAVEAYIDKDMSRFHMPGHKGALDGFLAGIAPYDVTEVAGTDSLYEADAAIARCEERFAALYGAHTSLLSAGGSTLCIQTMLALCVQPGETVLVARGAHTAAINAMGLLDLRPKWLYASAMDSGVSAPVTAADVALGLRKNKKTRAVYITSPTYLGQLSDIAGIAAVCHDAEVPLLVDNAHGAHLRLVQPDLHPMSLGADICCDSLHKTLPALTGAALLHIKNPALAADAKRIMSLFGSTSPSYIIMLSADMLTDYLADGAVAQYASIIQRVAALRELAVRIGFGVLQDKCDPIRLTLDFGDMGHTRESFTAHLRRYKIEPEYTGARHCVLLFSPHNKLSDISRLALAIEETTRQAPIEKHAIESSKPPNAKLTPRAALFAPWERVETERCVGRIAAAAVAPCPPGIPLLVPGELINASTQLLLKSYGVLHINVVK